MSERAHKWKKKAETVVFPSGLDAEIKNPDLFALMDADGNIPNSFYASMMTVDGKGQMDASAMSEDEKVVYFKTMMYLADKVAIKAFVSPKIVDEPDYDNDEIHLSDVELNDKQFLLERVMGGGDTAKPVKRFPGKKQKRRVATSQKK